MNATPNAPSNATPNAIHAHAEPAGHAHPADIDACLDFLNSHALSDGTVEDDLASVDEAVRYLVARGLAHDEALRAQASADGAAWLRRVHLARAALREIWDSQVDGRATAADAVATVNELLEHPVRLALHAHGVGVGVGHRHATDDPTGEALSRIAQPLVEAIAAGRTERFRICANDGCRWVFEDTSRGGRRRWCDMASCGNRAKVRRFRSKRRAAGAGEADAAPAPDQA